MKSNPIIALFACFTIAAIAAMAAAADTMPEPDGVAFWTYISSTNPYTKWEMWPGKEGLYPGNSPHGAYLKLYVNDVALKAIKEKAPMPDGAILVKENYGKDKETLLAITPMYLKKGYNPDNGDWFWAKYGADGKVMASGKVDGCISCHRIQTDWLFTEP